MYVNELALSKNGHWDYKRGIVDVQCLMISEPLSVPQGIFTLPGISWLLFHNHAVICLLRKMWDVKNWEVSLYSWVDCISKWILLILQWFVWDYLSEPISKSEAFNA